LTLLTCFRLPPNALCNHLHLNSTFLRLCCFKAERLNIYGKFWQEGSARSVTRGFSGRARPGYARVRGKGSRRKGHRTKEKCNHTIPLHTFAKPASPRTTLLIVRSLHFFTFSANNELGQHLQKSPITHLYFPLCILLPARSR